LCASVLAAGSGNRLRDLTTTETGTVIPKQFCTLQTEVDFPVIRTAKKAA
jgi:dTDP-glucose pyrophosphorylase